MNRFGPTLDFLFAVGCSYTAPAVVNASARRRVEDI